ncbi:MAG: hypothetical protein K2F70_07675, partial [Muribaculaceae bacterium]|nr:hypothetical protein [Muribaculaceae bacterium]
DARIAPSSTCKTHPKISSKSFAHKFNQFLKQYTLGFSPPNVTKKVLKTALFYLKLAKSPPFNMF